MGQLDGRVALVTGAARGQGRSHAVRLAQEGADIVALDICAPIHSLGYPLASTADLTETGRQVEQLGRRIHLQRIDVRDSGALEAALKVGVAELGRLDIVSANAGIMSYGTIEDMSDQTWNDVLDVNLTGVFKTVRATIPHLRRNADGGVIIITSSVAGIKGVRNLGHYAASKHGIVGLMKTLSIELAPFGIRVNTLHPTIVDTPMVRNQSTYDVFRPDLTPGEATLEDAEQVFRRVNLMGRNWIEPKDVSDALVWLSSDAARYVTGVQLPVDAGTLQM